MCLEERISQPLQRFPWVKTVQNWTAQEGGGEIIILIQLVR